MNRDEVISNLNRREFLSVTAAGGLALGLGVKAAAATTTNPQKSAAFNAASPASTVVLIRQENAVNVEHQPNPQVIGTMLDQAICQLTGEKEVKQAWGHFFKTTDHVGVKFTRCGWMRVHTEPALIDNIHTRLTQFGIAKDHLYGEDSGLPLEKITALINVPSVKVHTLTGIAAALKNYINFTGKESSYHGDGNAKLGEAWLLPQVKGKTRLIITDLLRPYFGPGPQINPLHRWDYKGILVGTDPVAMDAICVAICQTKRDQFKGEPWPITPPPKCVEHADKEFHLGTHDQQKIKLVRLGWDKEPLI
ncbi:DUF362 domain-containing protein [candidate division KSB1 bacterium]|nr:DUF362 domain-containing protein [candidate division KSB1 bacterium]